MNITGRGGVESIRVRMQEQAPVPETETAVATRHPLRSAVVDQICSRTGLDATFARDAEIGVYNWVLSYAGRAGVQKHWRNPRLLALYSMKARSVIANLDTSSYVGNHRLLTRVRDGEILPHDVAWMRPENVHPSRWQATLDLKTQQDNYVDNAKPAAMTDQYKCRRCSKREVSYVEMQLRSSDEPMSLFFTCLNCGERWRQG